MDVDTALGLLSGLFKLALQISLPLMLTALIVGVTVSLLQVVTQVQEMTLTFVPKIIAIVLVLALMGNWMLSSVVEFTVQMFQAAAIH